MEKKLTSEELEQFATARKEYSELRSRLCDITLAEERLKTDKQVTLMNISESTAALSELHAELQEKYGDGAINMLTGEVS
jgi:hypothetical protein